MSKYLKSKLGLTVLLVAMIGFGCDYATESVTPEITEDQIESLSPGDIIEGQYIVVFDIDDKAKAVNLEFVNDLRSAVTASANIPSDRISASYNVALQGFAANLSDSQVDILNRDERISYIERDKVVGLAPPCGTPNGGPCDPDDGDGGDDGDNGGDTIIPWGIDRVGGSVNYSGGAVSWVIDTGIQLDHPDLNVDVNRGFTAFTSGPDSRSADDGNGHGTHVAGTVGAFNGILGVASGVSQVPVKVLDRRGSGSISGVIAGVDYVAANANAGDVANMSLGGGASDALDAAVVSAANNGILFSIAAGNSSTWASNSSPARVDHPNTWTIAATDINDSFASFSNYGPPTSFAAPGVNVESTWISSGYRTISGTSMAAPHVAGILIVTGGTVSTNGQSSTAPDGETFPIASHK